MTQNQYTDLERLEVVAKRIRESQIDLTAQYSDWRVQGRLITPSARFIRSMTDRSVTRSLTIA